MNSQVHHIEGQERKINKSNHMIMQPHHSLIKVYIISTPVKCSILYVSYTLAVCYDAQSKRSKENKKRRKVASMRQTASCSNCVLRSVCYLCHLLSWVELDLRSFKEQSKGLRIPGHLKLLHWRRGLTPIDKTFRIMAKHGSVCEFNSALEDWKTYVGGWNSTSQPTTSLQRERKGLFSSVRVVRQLASSFAVWCRQLRRTKDLLRRSWR